MVGYRLQKQTVKDMSEKDTNGSEFATVQLVVDKSSAIDGVFEWNPSLFDGLEEFMNNGSVSVQVLCSVS